MSDQLLTLAKFGLLALLYLFFARTLWAVWSEVRSPAAASGSPGGSGGGSRGGTPSGKAKARNSQPAASNPGEPAPATPALSAASSVASSAASPSALPSAGSSDASPVAAADGSQTSASALGKNSPAASAEELPKGKLVVVEPVAQNGIIWPLERELTIGRAPGCGVPVDDTFVSQLHARVWAAGGTWMVEDLGSTNGTVFNGDALTEPRVMQMGDQIRVGSTVLELR